MELLGDAIQQGIAPAIIVAIYLVIVKILDFRKDAKQAKLNGELAKSINIISTYIEDTAKKVVERDKDKCKAAIENAMFASASRLIQFISTTLINNHIDANKENILINIHNIINGEFYNVYSTLALFKIDDVKVCDYLNKDWMQIVEDDMINIIYNTNLSVDNKILSFTNKINLTFQSYIVYITNQIIK